ncbi:hypothetical protein MTO96_042320 [Rhipicephalus appendiculatus]
MPPLRRQQYSAAFKRQVILYAESESNVEAGRKFDVSQKCVREWSKQGTKIFACAATRRSFRGPKSGRYPAVEEAVRDWVHDQRSESLSVCYDDIEAKARTVAKGMCIPLTAFKVSKKWITNFMKRNGLSLRRRTTVCQRLPEAYEEKQRAFLRYVSDLKAKHSSFSQVTTTSRKRCFSKVK